MQVELLVVPGCPHHGAAVAALHSAAAAAGVPDVDLVTTVIETDADARRRGFTGSPTFLIAGIDPFARPDAPVGVCCRIYPTSGGPAGVPEVTALRDALERAAAVRE